MVFTRALISSGSLLMLRWSESRSPDRRNADCGSSVSTGPEDIMMAVDTADLLWSFCRLKDAEEDSLT